jgi:hypothetical protein
MEGTKARFGSLTSDDIDIIEDNKDSENTKKVIKKSVNILRAFLAEKGQDENFEELSNEDMDVLLKDFYANARTVKGEKYKLTSFRQIKYGIGKFLMRKEIDIDSNDFSKSNTAFKALSVDLIKQGKGDVKHKPPIASGDLQKLYQHPRALNPETPFGLQKKVLFEVIIYFCRRGRENLVDMTKDTFRVGTDDEGREYVEQALSEFDKNHRDQAKADDTIGDGRMYNKPANHLCPVTSYKFYLSKLHPEINDLWQRPLDSFDSDADVWYYRKRIGVHTLDSCMTDLSKQTGLSQIYTNHSIRARSLP